MSFQNKIRRKRGIFALTLLLMITALRLPLSAAEERPHLYVGGIPFGVRFVTDGVLVVDYCDVACGGTQQNPAKEAGLCPGDCICKINGERTATAARLSEMIDQSGGRELTLSYKRNGEEKELRLTPLPCDEDGRFRTGLFVRDSGAGIGTVTFVTEQNTFGGLGHGICDGGSGTPIPIERGSVTAVEIVSITRGAAGAPGELKGKLSGSKLGALTQNTPCGVFGAFGERPDLPAGAMPIAYRDEVHDGAVTLWCTLDDNAPRAYTAEISAIHHRAEGNKCFTVTVTDQALLERTGGIVQGMSGSPIIQDGRLIGAVTHVLIGDPTTGYGIFIENMLANMAMPLQ